MRREFTKKTKSEAFLRSKGLCERCTAKLFDGNIEYDHSTACGIDGDNTLENCVVLCRNCHSAKTTKEDVPRIAKAKRNYRKAANIKGERQIRSWRKFDGTPVYASKSR